MTFLAGFLGLLLGFAGPDADGLWPAPLERVQDEPESAPEPMPPVQEDEPPVEESPAWEPEGEGSSLLDFGSMEIAARAGMVMFSEDFEADPEMAYGLFVRVPSSWVSIDIFDCAEPDFGFWVEGVISEIDRDEDLQLETPDDTIFFAGAGIDYELIWDRGDGWSWYLRAMAGGQYGSFGDVDDLHNGAAATVGVLLGLEIGGIAITVTPQWAIAEAGDWIGFGHAGLGLRF